MRKYRNTLPPQRCLITFEAAARLSSFTNAAKELSITQVAVSRQIKELESYVEVLLFERLNKSVQLTPEGHELFFAVSAGLEQIHDAIVNIKQSQNQNHLTVGTTTAFSACWLMPRLADFHKRFPEIDLRLSVMDDLVNLKDHAIHMSIRYGHGNWKGLDATYLCESDVRPVCSPLYLNNGHKITSPEDLLGEFLIDFDYVIDSTWRSWFEFSGMDSKNIPKSPAKLSLDAYTSLVNAALTGQGIALLGSPLVDMYLDAGLLVCPLDIPAQKLAGAYYLVVPEGAEPCFAVQKFKTWLIAQIQA
ncbi:MAG: LysR substrate-binding domain-containing protein [Alphaproteobacteria bacterium]|nr:LysR substrate-binding domain-containing protein [Alphaproteobacteria bacterium]